MELMDIYRFIKRHIWLLLFGLVLGVIAGFLYTRIKPPEYVAMAKVLVTRSSPDKSSSYGYLTDAQLILTYQYLFTTAPVLEETSQELGFQVDAKKITVANVIDTMILMVSYEDRDPVKAAKVANTLVNVLINQNTALQKNQNTIDKQSLEQQIAQLKTQIDDLQTQYDTRSTTLVDEQLQQVNAQIKTYQNNILILEKAIASIGTPTSPEQRALLAEKQAALNEYQPLLNLYQQIQTNLEYLGRPYQSGSGPEDQPLTRLNALITQYQNVYFTLLKSLADIELKIESTTPALLRIEEATPPSEPAAPFFLFNPAVLGFIGLFLGILLALFLEVIDTRIRGREQIRANLGMFPLGQLNRRSNHLDLFSPDLWACAKDMKAASQFYNLRTSLEVIRQQTPFKVLLVSSFMEGDGKSWTAVNLAINYACGGKKVVLVDANSGRHWSPDGAGFSDLAFSDQAYKSDYLKSTGVSGLKYLAFGEKRPEPLQLIEPDRISALISGLRRGRDIVIIDASELSDQNTRILAGFVDAILLVMRPGAIKKETALEKIHGLQANQQKVVGVVMNFAHSGNLEKSKSLVNFDDLRNKVNNIPLISRVFANTSAETEQKSDAQVEKDRDYDEATRDYHK